MNDVPDTTALAAVARRIEPEGRLLRAWPVGGGVSAQTTGLEIALPGGGTRRVIVRQHGEADRSRDPEIASHEYAVLRALHAAGLPVPAPVHVDASCEVLPTPYVVLAYVAGSVIRAGGAWRGRVPRLAACLAQIHSVDWASADLGFLPRVGRGFGARPAQLDDSLQEGRIREALASAASVSPQGPDRLLHGDYWPGNVLWAGSRIVAVVDWEDASLGDPLADLANSRLEVLWAFGIDAMQAFTRHYTAHAPWADETVLPYWDLCAALRPASKLGSWGLAPPVEQAMREGHRWFVARALERLRGARARARDHDTPAPSAADGSNC